MNPPVHVGTVDPTAFVPLSAEDGGWTPVAGDPAVEVHTLCENKALWSGVAILQPCTFSYPAQHPGAIEILDGAATISVDDRTWEVTAGDVVYLTPGTTSTWVVHRPLREFFVAFLGE